MGEVIRTEIRDEALRLLRAHNRAAPEGKLRIYADAFTDYALAQKNIDENGAVCAHPKTGSPIDNPYLKVRDRAAKALQDKNVRLKTDALWEMQIGGSEDPAV